MKWKKKGKAQMNSSIGTLEALPDPQVVEKPKRRSFSAEYKLRILEKADRCKQAGQIGALLRREGLYSSNLRDWRRQRRKGAFAALTSKKRGRKAREKNPLSERVRQLEREKEQLRQRLEKAELVIEVQKKVSLLLGIQQAEGARGELS